jgi:hypothetical protein
VSSTKRNLQQDAADLRLVCFYAGLNALALLWIFLFVPETKAMTLEELDRECWKVIVVVKQD